MQGQKLSALIFGSTGAIGAELTRLLAQSSKWGKIHCVVRQELPEWETMTGNEKLHVERFPDLSLYFSEQKVYSNVDAVFCCLGSQVKHGEQTFRKIDKEYPLRAASLALANHIPHYVLVSSGSSNPDSWFLYLKVKGEVERQLSQKGLKLLSILKPGLLVDRRNARIGEKCFSWVPFIPKIYAHEAASMMMSLAQAKVEESRVSHEKVQVYSNGQMLAFNERAFNQNK